MKKYTMEITVNPFLLPNSFSAASNISGILTDTLAVTALLHRHDALAFWDYATAAPYVKIDMNPKGILFYFLIIFLALYVIL